MITSSHRAATLPAQRWNGQLEVRVVIDSKSPLSAGSHARAHLTTNSTNNQLYAPFYLNGSESSTNYITAISYSIGEFLYDNNL